MKEPPDGLEALTGLDLAWPSPDDSLHPRRGARVITMHPATGLIADLIHAEAFRGAATLMFVSMASSWSPLVAK